LFPHHVLRRLKQLAADVLDEEAAKDPVAGKVNKAFQRFQKNMRKFSLIRGADIRL
jgi:TRAP-type mannitol/chloroaromatic compound transport system substrate-binding protein